MLFEKPINCIYDHLHLHPENFWYLLIFRLDSLLVHQSLFKSVWPVRHPSPHYLPHNHKAFFFFKKQSLYRPWLDRLILPLNTLFYQHGHACNRLVLQYQDHPASICTFLTVATYAIHVSFGRVFLSEKTAVCTPTPTPTSKSPP